MCHHVVSMETRTNNQSLFFSSLNSEGRVGDALKCTLNNMENVGILPQININVTSEVKVTGSDSHRKLHQLQL